ncbi:hypothetical protein WJX73_010041 [Symbiochloris irregularis]|uniref:Uncharacterized protein n=1 Tax=Symbiochloris irregularis TaxID=706552 RepID=A0AAW1NVZ4_9CHLO
MPPKRSHEGDGQSEASPRRSARRARSAAETAELNRDTSGGANAYRMNTAGAGALQTGAGLARRSQPQKASSRAIEDFYARRLPAVNPMLPGMQLPQAPAPGSSLDDFYPGTMSADEHAFENMGFKFDNPIQPGSLLDEANKKVAQGLIPGRGHRSAQAPGSSLDDFYPGTVSDQARAVEAMCPHLDTPVQPGSFRDEEQQKDGGVGSR